MRIAPAVVCLLLAGVSATAQSPYPNPYTQPPGPPVPCGIYVPVVDPSCGLTGLTEEFDFANVFLNVSGYEHTFVAVKNKSDEYSAVVLEVTVTGQSPVRRRMVLAPQERPNPVKLNDWPELQGVRTGVSVVVRANKPLSVTAAMHPNDPETFWTGARILEGR